MLYFLQAMSQADMLAYQFGECRGSQIQVSDPCGIRQIDIQVCQLGSLLAGNTTYAAGSFVVNEKLQML